MRFEWMALALALFVVLWSLGGFAPPVGAAHTTDEEAPTCPHWLFYIRSLWPYTPHPEARCRWERSLSDMPGNPGPVKTGVHLGPLDLSGWERGQVEDLLAQLQANLQFPPENAEYNASENKVIPSLNGVSLDADATLDALFVAPPDTDVTPRFKQVPADVTLSDYPTAIVYHGHPRKREVTITINVAWEGEYLGYLRDMLDVLDEAGAHTTFFLEGQWVTRHPDLVRELQSRGHELANHGFSEAHPSELSVQQLQSEIERTSNVIEELTGEEVRYFSPFYGEYSDQVVRTAGELGYTTVRWSIDTVDWQLPGIERIVDKVANNLHPGAIILMHPTEQSASGLRGILEVLKRRNLELVPLSVLLSPQWVPALDPSVSRWPEP